MLAHSTPVPGVYNQLTDLTRLRHLDLEFENRDEEHPPHKSYEVNGRYYSGFNGLTLDTLELSLASGLDHLGGLRHLEMVGFECINHRIGRAEVEWMAKSWPNLSLMYRLDKERISDAEPDQEGLSWRHTYSSCDPMWCMAPCIAATSDAKFFRARDIINKCRSCCFMAQGLRATIGRHNLVNPSRMPQEVNQG